MLISLDRLARLLMSPDAGPDAGGSAAVADAPAPEAAGGDEFADPGDGDDFASDPGLDDLPGDTPAAETEQPTGGQTADDTVPETGAEVAEPSGEGATQQQQPSIDQDLLGIAETFGLPAAVARGFGSNQALAAHLSLMAQVKPLTAETPQQDQPQYQLEEPLQQHLQKMADEGVSEEIINGIRLGFESHGQKIAQLEKVNNDLLQVAQRRELEQRAGWFEQQLAATGLDDVFGKGSINDLKQGTPEFNARLELYKQFDHWTKSGLPQQQAWSVALHALHGDKLQTIARKQVEQDVNQFNSQRTSRPTQRASRPPTGREAALAKARKAYSGWNMADDGGSDEADGLL